jgi:SAM-dependent methyltransferase
MNFKNKILYCITKILYKKIHKIYNFNEELVNLELNFYNDVYKKHVINFAQLIKPETVLDLGCGLGEITSRVIAKKVLGVDNNNNVLNAAKHLNPNVNFYFADFTIVKSIFWVLQKNNFKSIDLLILTSNFHLYDTNTVLATLRKINDRFPIKYLIIDGVKRLPTDNIRYYHGDNIHLFGKVIASNDEDIRRTLYLIEYNP